MFNRHRPPHIYLDNQIYFITANTFRRIKYFEKDSTKELIKGILFLLINRYKLKLYAWVILDNHYHLLIKINAKIDLSRFVRKFHSDIALLINALERKKGQRVIYQYWDKCVETDNEYWTRFNYIHHNPVKHGLVYEMSDFLYFSYRYYLLEKGNEWLCSCFEAYPIIDFTNDAKLTLR